MVRAKKAAGPRQEITVTFRHTGEWNQSRHGPSFLRPLVDGERRRMTAVVKPSPGTGPPAG